MSGTMTFGIFPVVRKLSRHLVAPLAQLPVTPNQITALSLLSGLAAAACFLQDAFSIKLAGAILFVICYLLDNCDGEIARLKNLSTRFGEFFDTFTDWAVHTVFFAGLGYGVYQARGNTLWLWLGMLAAGGATINYLIGVFGDAGSEPRSPAGPDKDRADNKTRDLVILVFRELMRADFCFIVLFLTLLDLEWLLLPLAAAGSQVYWMMQFMENAKKFHV